MTDKVHTIIQFKNPATGVTSEHHLDSAPKAPKDSKTHLFSLTLNPSNNSYAVNIDGGDAENTGTFSTGFTPPFIPPTEIDDPEDKKPADWVDAAKIADPAASKPEDWDEDAPRMIDDEDAIKPENWKDSEPALIADPKAELPADWNTEDDGEWVAPQIPNPACAEGNCGEWKRPQKVNPAYKGKWVAPLIDNPAYVGVWAPHKIPNPAFFTVPDGQTLGELIFSDKSFKAWLLEVQNPVKQTVDDVCVTSGLPDQVAVWEQESEASYVKTKASEDAQSPPPAASTEAPSETASAAFDFASIVALLQENWIATAVAAVALLATIAFWPSAAVTVKPSAAASARKAPAAAKEAETTAAADAPKRAASPSPAKPRAKSQAKGRVARK